PPLEPPVPPLLPPVPPLLPPVPPVGGAGPGAGAGAGVVVVGVTGVVVVGVVVGTGVVVVGTVVGAPPAWVCRLFALPQSFMPYWVAADSAFCLALASSVSAELVSAPLWTAVFARPRASTSFFTAARKSLSAARFSCG